MTTKTIYMNGDGDINDDGEYVYPNSDEDYPNCINSECSDKDQIYDQEDFYESLEIVSEHKLDKTKDQTKDQTSKVKTKLRSMSFDSEGSDISKRPNFKCGSSNCKKSFLLDKNQKMIRCSYCGYRILYKLRTRNVITFKTE